MKLTRGGAPSNPDGPNRVRWLGVFVLPAHQENDGVMPYGDTKAVERALVP
jgi:hypothetical protein